ncbi:MAG: hypothetical protein IH625_02150 [Rhodobacteraceae bacterium]|nr:hypothetical protein [Paracoccaceae bacterium]
MRLALVAVALGLASGAGAGCLPEGKTPSAVQFADGAVIDHIARDGDMLSYTSYDDDGEGMQTSVRWGLYPDHSAYHGEGVRYDWQGTTLPPPAELVAGEEISLSARQVMSGTAQSFVMTVRLIGPAEVQVGDCRYPVLHLAVTMGTAEKVRIEGERWLDPSRLVMWASTTRILDKAGKLERVVTSRATGATE